MLDGKSNSYINIFVAQVRRTFSTQKKDLKIDYIYIQIISCNCFRF